jgi:hypothetical protein
MTKPKKARRPSSTKRTKKAAGKQPEATRERLKPISLWPLSFDEALDALLAGGKPSKDGE